MKRTHLFSLFVIVALITFMSCGEDDPVKATLPTVTTADVADITDNSATAGGEVKADGQATVTARGVCWSTTANPTIGDNIKEIGTGVGAFEGTVDNLEPNTTYHLRAYATNKAGTAYGNEVVFSTIQILPVITTQLMDIQFDHAVIGGDAIGEGESAVTERGICFAETVDPTTNDTKFVAASAGAGSFTVTIDGLQMNYTYHVRAYAINSAGTSYGEDMEFTTINTVVDASNNTYNLVKIGTQIWMGENLKTLKYNNGDDIIAEVSSYDDSDINADIYGRLYSWTVATNTNGVCPSGMHVPTILEWNTLFSYAGGIAGADASGGALKESGNDHWASGSSTDEFAFTALPAGYGYQGTYGNLGEKTYFWASAEASATTAVSYSFAATSDGFQYSALGKTTELSVRCIADPN